MSIFLMLNIYILTWQDVIGWDPLVKTWESGEIS